MDLIHRNVPLSGLAVRQQAFAFFKFLQEQSPSSLNEIFAASRGWFDRFKAKFSPNNVSSSEKKASADQGAATSFPAQLKNLLKEKGYYDQIFNYDETGLTFQKSDSPYCFVLTHQAHTDVSLC